MDTIQPNGHSSHKNLVPMSDPSIWTLRPERDDPWHRETPDRGTASRTRGGDGAHLAWSVRTATERAAGSGGLDRSMGSRDVHDGSGLVASDKEKEMQFWQSLLIFISQQF